jgi:hypothetical protein
MNIRDILLTLGFSFLMCPVHAQKITLGSCITKDKGEYNGEMSAGKPNGKGKTVWKNGDVYE